jgi:hypothetical protein
VYIGGWRSQSSFVEQGRLEIFEIRIALQQLLYQGKGLRIAAGDEIAVTLALAFFAEIVFIQRRSTRTKGFHDQFTVFPPRDEVILLV